MRARANGRVLLQRDFLVDDLCAGSRYFCALLRGGFRESLAMADCVDGDHNKDHIVAPVDVVLPLPDTAPRDLVLVMDHVAGVAARALLPLDACLLYRPLLEYIGADDCLAACAAIWRDAVDAWPPRSPQCPTCAQRADSAHGGISPALMIDPDLVIAAYACAADATNDPFASVPNLARPLFDRERFWTLGRVWPDTHPPAGCDCDEEDDYAYDDAKHAWLVRARLVYACYGDALLAACDRASLRINDGAVVAESAGAACLDACVRRDAVLLSAATTAALRDWYRAISAAVPFTATPYALSLCNLFEARSARRLRVHASVDLCASDGGNDSGEDNESIGDGTGITPRGLRGIDKHNSGDGPFCHLSDDTRERLCDGRPRKRPRREAAQDVRVTVDTKEAFESALRRTFPHTADAVLGLVGQGVVLAGGCVVESVQRESLRAHLPTSDMDLWVIGADDCERRATFRRVINGLFEALPQHRATVDGSVVTFVHPSDGRPNDTVQVVFTDARCGGDVIAQFDLAHTAAYYDGNTVWALWDCAWSLVTRRTDAISNCPVRRARVDHAILKGFDPLRACVLATVDDHPAPPTNDGTQKEAAYHTDPVALLTTFTHRTIDASRYNDHCRAMGRPGVVLDDPIYLSMPPLRVAFGAECAQCRGRNIASRGAPLPCRCTDAPSATLAVELPRHLGDCRDPLKARCMAERGALFRRQIKAAESSLKERYTKTLGEGVVVGTPSARCHHAMNRKCDDNDGNNNINGAVSGGYPDDCGCSRPDLLVLKCLGGATSAFDAMTGESLDLPACARMWIAGRVAYHRVDRAPHMLVAALIAVELSAYPPDFESVVESLDQAAQMVPSLGVVATTTTK